MSSNCCNNYWFFCIFYIFLREFDKNQKFFCFFFLKYWGKNTYFTTFLNKEKALSASFHLAIFL
ncbi:hypothetical protein DPW26_05835 [Enterococcus faecium]|nr:hypothetical protein DPW26_05835 [Enterococcus faecium]